MAEYRLEMRGVSKSFPGVKALDKINLKVRPGTVHALMGENGAGKSTLMKCLFGIYHMDEGEVYLDGEKVEIHNPDEALHRGLAMVHQELQPIPERTVAENMYTGRYPTKKFGPIQVIDHKKMFEETANGWTMLRCRITRRQNWEPCPSPRCSLSRLPSCILKCQSCNSGRADFLLDG